MGCGKYGHRYGRRNPHPLAPAVQEPQGEIHGIQCIGFRGIIPDINGWSVIDYRWAGARVPLNTERELTERQLLKGNTPALVLAVLADAPRHGYGIAREIERRSGNALRFKEGTLYPALHALERDGLITGAWSGEGGGRERKVYRITPAGLGELERRTRTWTEFATAIFQVI